MSIKVGALRQKVTAELDSPRSRASRLSPRVSPRAPRGSDQDCERLHRELLNEKKRVEELEEKVACTVALETEVQALRNLLRGKDKRIEALTVTVLLG